MEAFTSRLRRIGYRFDGVSANTTETSIKPNRGKIITAVILTLIGFLLIQQLKNPIRFYESWVNDIEYSGSLFILLVSTFLFIIGCLSVYKGLNRLIDFLGFHISIVQNELIFLHRHNFKLKREVLSNVTNFDCLDDGNDIVITCTNSNNEEVTIIREKDSVVDCRKTLQELTQILNSKVK